MRAIDQKERSRRAALFSLYLTVSINAMGFSFMLPLMPYFARELHATSLEIGILISSYPIVQAALSPFVGRLSDTIGRRKVITVSLGLGTISAFLMGLAPTYGSLFLARVLHGLVGTGIAPVVRAAVADLTANKERATTMGHLASWQQSGQIIGPVFASGLVTVGTIRWPFFVAGVLSFANFLLAQRYLTETIPFSTTRPNHEPANKPSLRQFMAGTMGMLLTIIFVWQLTTSIAQVAFPLLLHDLFDLGKKQYGYFAGAGALIMVITGGFLIKPITDKIGDRKTILLGLATLTCTTVAIPWAPTVALVVVAYISWMFGTALARPTAQGLISGITKFPQGATMGTMQVFDSTGRIIGPIMGGWLYAYGPKVPFAVADGLLLLVLIVAVVRLRHE